jgi:hypothetical protein
MKITTAFFMPFCNVLERVTACLLSALLIFGAMPAQAAKTEESISVLYATLSPSDDNLSLSAALAVRLNKTQQDALKKGLSLHFLTDFELERRRAWWLNEEVVSLSRAGRLTYNLLTRRYQIETADGFKAVDTLGEALIELGRIENWIVAPRKLLKPGERYIAAIRMRLDQGQLPKPLQINALTSGKWEVEGDWHEWEVAP